jgi:hypothetical protein
MFDRIATPIIALGLAFLVWLYIRSRDQEVYERNVPVVLRMSPQQRDSHEIYGEEKMEIPVSFTGPPSRIREVRTMVQRGEINLIRTITVPESAVNADRFTFTDTLEANQLNVPPGVRVDIPPDRRKFPVVVRRIVKKALEVKVRFLGDEERVANLVIEPKKVEVRGPQEILSKEDTILTEVVPLPTTKTDRPDEKSEREETINRTALLHKRINETLMEVTPPAVKLSFMLKPSQQTHELHDVPVLVLQPPDFPYRIQFPAQRAGTIPILKVKGPAQKPTGIIAYIDLSKKPFDALQPGLQPDEPINILLPPGYELDQKQPRLPPYNLVPIAPPAKPPT